MRKISIYGIGGLYNYGCEAIVRGTVDFIKLLYGEKCCITYYSKNHSNDKRIAEELGISIANISRTPTLISRCISKVVNILQIPITPFYEKEFEQIINESDVIISVGGDIYTIPAYRRNKEKYRYVNYLVEFGNQAIEKGKSVIIYGASIGPFGNYKKALSYYTEHFKKIDTIICREQVSVDYLKSLGVTGNVVMLPDPAFLVEDEQKGIQTEKKYVGVNLSELSLCELYGSVSEKTILKLAKLLSEIYVNTGKPLMLIPHVNSPVEVSDNDEVFLSRVFEKLPEQVKQVSILVKPTSFLDAKNYLKQCVIAVCARMHCAVNAITVNTPALFLVYSSKALGMAEYIYGHRKWCISLNDMESELVNKVKNMLDELDLLKDQISNCQRMAKSKYAEYINICKDEKGWMN